MAVAMVVAGPLFGIFGARLYKEMRRHAAQFMFMAPLAGGAFLLFPALWIGFLVTDPRFSIHTHHREAMYGLAAGYAILLGGGVYLLIERWYRGRRRSVEDA